MFETLKWVKRQEEQDCKDLARLALDVEAVLDERYRAGFYESLRRHYNTDCQDCYGPVPNAASRIKKAIHMMDALGRGVPGAPFEAIMLSAAEWNTVRGLLRDALDALREGASEAREAQNSGQPGAQGGA